MANYTYATVIVPSENQAKAQAIAGADTFVAGLSADGTQPATHYVTSGPFDNDQLNQFTDAEWKKTIRFGDDWQAAIAELQLQGIIDGIG